MVPIDKLKVQLALLNNEPKLTQQDLAGKIGTSPQALSNSLSAGRMTEARLQRIADVLDRPAAFFMKDPPRPQSHVQDNVTREGSPRAFIVDDKQLYFYTDSNRYASLEKIISMACALGFRDQIQEILDRQ